MPGGHVHVNYARRPPPLVQPLYWPPVSVPNERQRHAISPAVTFFVGRPPKPRLSPSKGAADDDCPFLCWTAALLLRGEVLPTSTSHPTKYLSHPQTTTDLRFQTQSNPNPILPHTPLRLSAAFSASDPVAPEEPLVSLHPPCTLHGPPATSHHTPSSTPPISDPAISSCSSILPPIPVARSPRAPPPAARHARHPAKMPPEAPGPRPQVLPAHHQGRRRRQAQLERAQLPPLLRPVAPLQDPEGRQLPREEDGQRCLSPAHRVRPAVLFRADGPHREFEADRAPTNPPPTATSRSPSRSSRP